MQRTFKMATFGAGVIRPARLQRRGLKRHREAQPRRTACTYLGQDGGDRGSVGNQRLVDIHEAAKRRCWTHTWLRSNQPPGYVLTPSCVPPPPNASRSSYPVKRLLHSSPSSSDPLLLGVICPFEAAHFPTLSFLQVFRLFLTELLEFQPDSKSVATLLNAVCRRNYNYI